MNQNIYITPRFRRVVTLHIVKNILRTPPNIQVPLILGIHGPSGEGKTFQCGHILGELGVGTYLISGGQMESSEAGRPAELIRQTYLQAGRDVQEGKCSMAVLLINDFDTAIGDWGELVQYTVNRQTVFAELMHIADFPENVENQNTVRIPIITTGNNFLRLYEPLIRFGRMWSFEWKPTIEEKIKIVEGIFPNLKKSKVRNLVLHYKEQRVAFFSYLRNAVLDDSLWKQIEKINTKKVISKIQKKGIKGLNLSYNLEKLQKVAERAEKEGVLINHLDEEVR